MAHASDEARLVRQLYEGALQRDPEEREEYLDLACADHPHLRARVEALLANESPDIRASQLRTGIAADTPRDYVDGEVVGPYIIRRELGHGGMGVVYLADDTRLSRRVALKALSGDLSQDSHGRERLRREARAAAALSHPGIATVYAIEEIGQQLYIASEYVPGEPLRALVRSGPLPVTQVIEIGLQLARALSAAHTAGIVHRDIKPENIIRTPSGVVKVLDFGLARVETSPYLSQTGIVVGTPAYLSPEQALGGNVDFRTDIFALGLVLYELVSGVNPFAASTITATIARILESNPSPVSETRPEVLPELDRIIETCLRKDPAERYQSTEALVAELEELAADIVERRRTGSHDSRARPTRGIRRAPPRWWWQFHQLTVTSVYILMLYPSWLVHGWLPAPWSMLFLLAILATSAAAVSLRLHVWFVTRFFPAEAAAQQQSSRLAVRWCDVALAAFQIAAGAAIADRHAQFAMLLVVVSTSMLVATFVIEPSTARVAFPPGTQTSSSSHGS